MAIARKVLSILVSLRSTHRISRVPRVLLCGPSYEHLRVWVEAQVEQLAVRPSEEWRVSGRESAAPLVGSNLPAHGRQRGDYARHDWRIVLYSHDTMGLGHVRRNLLIAQSLRASPYVKTILLIAGAHEAGEFRMPPGVDCLTLPSLHKQSDGSYRSRRLDLSAAELIELRRNAIRAAVAAFEPHAMIVDKVPRGAMAELDSTLVHLRRQCHTCCVLGLRDVLDDPAAVAREWQAAANEQVIENYYDAIWVYGDPQVCDVAREYRFSTTLLRKLHYTGYLDPAVRLASTRDESPQMTDCDLPAGPIVVCHAGGGEDGGGLAEAFAEAELPAGTHGVIVTGPFMPSAVRQRVRFKALAHGRMRVVEFLREPEYVLRRADCVVAMGGYNSVCEILSLGKPALVVPRIHPRQEQLIRASRLAELGLIEMLHPDRLTPQALSAWLAREHPQLPKYSRLDFGGLARLPGLLHALLTRQDASFQPVAARGQQAPWVVESTGTWSRTGRSAIGGER